MKILMVLAVLLMSTVAEAQSASLKVCFTEPNADTTKMQLLANNNTVVPDLYPGSVLTGTTRCSTVPFPSALVRGTDYQMTIKGVNALGEVGPASNALPFRAPNLPAVPTGLTVQIQVP